MIESTHFTLAIIAMASITFLVRYAFFSTHIKVRLNESIKGILLFTAPCILTALLVPIMFQAGIETKNLTLLLSSSYLWGGIFAIVFSLFIRNTLVVILLSMLVFYGLRLWI